jgi:hypothetical protein
MRTRIDQLEEIGKLKRKRRKKSMGVIGRQMEVDLEITGRSVD